MPTYQLFVSDDQGGRLIPLEQDVIDKSPALRAILNRTSERESATRGGDGYAQSYGQSNTHNRQFDQESPGRHSKSYSKQRT
jgi:hypothetical protein